MHKNHPILHTEPKHVITLSFLNKRRRLIHDLYIIHFLILIPTHKILFVNLQHLHRDLIIGNRIQDLACLLQDLISNS